MFATARSWRVLVGGVATGVAGVVGLAGATASAEPTLPPAPPVPAPVTVTQTVVVPETVGPVPATADAATTVAVAPQIAEQQAATAPVVPAAPVSTLVPASSGTLREYFGEKGVQMEPQNPRDFRALHITLPVPTGWTQVPDPNVPDAFAVIADRVGGDGLYTSNAQVVVYRLVGDFNPEEAITHGFIDSQQLTNWQSTDASLATFGGFPSSLIEGTYRQNDMTLNTSRRHVIATAGADRYLVSLSVTTAVNQAVAAAGATDAIVNGFRVTDPATASPASPAAPASPASPLTSATPALPAAPAASAASAPAGASARG
ncbi:LpqN/LpqT family lipoprotein, partial [Mycolicibacterium palauense]|uniref:LpqN/LpqT family lipoprotein n=1 Tax=Mycolicibacterium palauense TaxID=2034511 RepID=UPI0011455E54